MDLQNKRKMWRWECAIDWITAFEGSEWVTRPDTRLIISLPVRLIPWQLPFFCTEASWLTGLSHFLYQHVVSVSA